ncbi:unnamed protein product [Adineta steineri]|uniref:Uncharacterized protein n=1 Tax=Adineta steineri TaxID=433720 RepID=A0A814RE12_9BILA|nr:unnamed protein product [Adineta steineri]
MDLLPALPTRQQLNKKSSILPAQNPERRQSNITNSIGMVVAFIPEGLPAAVTLVLTIVAKRIYKTSSDTIHFVFLPIPVYYRLTRLIYGKDYNPFGDIQYGLHPVAKFYKDYQKQLRFLFHTSKYILPTIFIYFIMNFFEKIILPKLQKNI